MLKYIETLITFSEVPDEISLCINISNCPCRCEGCHSPYLAEDIGKPLTINNLNDLIHANAGITCVCFMGGDGDPASINELAHKVKSYGLKTCWYSGRQELAKEIDLQYWNFIKLGPYIKELGSLDCPATNQRFYVVEESSILKDITDKFWIKNKF